MRTTVILEDQLAKILRKSVAPRRLSEFINQCIREHLDARDKVKRLKALEASYERANQDVTDGFDSLDLEGWPE